MKISELPASGILDGNEVIPIVQGSATVQVNAQAIADLSVSGVSQTYVDDADALLTPLTDPRLTDTRTPTDDSVTSAKIVDGTIVDVDINASAGIALSKLATDPLARANHTGTQLAVTISDFDAAALAAGSTAYVPLSDVRLTDTRTPTDNSVTSAKIANGAIVDADINASAAIVLSKLATDPLARANHTGTQVAATVSDFNATVVTAAASTYVASTAIRTIVQLTQAAYTALGTPDANTLYVIVG